MCGTKRDRQRRGFPHALRGPSEPGSMCYCVATPAGNFRPIIDGHINPTRFRLFKAFVGGDDLCWTKKSYAASRGFIASLVRSRLVCRPRSIAPTLWGWTSAPTGCPNGSTTAAFSPRARSGACEIARARSVLLGIGSELLAQKSAVLQDRMIASSMSNEGCWLAAALRLGGPRTPIVAST